ncbi:MAG: hypothetical protein RLZZ468_601 [Cyanobacteriota bacterium]
MTPQAPQALDAGSRPGRSEAELRDRQLRGELQVRTAAEYRQLVQQAGLAEAFASTDVVVAAEALFTDQASLQLSLGPADPPIRLRALQLANVRGLAGCGPGEVLLPIGGGLTDGGRRGGAHVLAALLAGEPVPLAASGEATLQHPRRELHGDLSLGQIGGGRLLLHRAIQENGIVAVSSAEGLCHTPHGALLGPLVNALYTCPGAGSIGLTMPGLSLLGPGSPVLVAGGIGWVLGSGSGHQPQPRRQSGGQALSPGASAAVAVDLHALDPRWIRACFFEGHGSALLVAIAAPVPLLDPDGARQAAAGPAELQAPVLDLAIPRRVKPALGSISYAELESGRFQLNGASLRCAPAHSPRLAASLAADLAERLRSGQFPLRLPALPLTARPALRPLDLG